VKAIKPIKVHQIKAVKAKVNKKVHLKKASQTSEKGLLKPLAEIAKEVKVLKADIKANKNVSTSAALAL
jgi:hypothetical protein